MDKASSANVSHSASNVVCEKEVQTGGTGLATTISFSGYTGATTRLADAGTGTISFDHQHGADGNVGSSRIWDTGGGMDSHAGATGGGATADGNRSLLDLSRKDDLKVPVLGSYRGSRLKLNLLGRPRRVLRNDDSTGSDESVEVGEGNNQTDSKERVGTTSEFDGSLRKTESLVSESLKNGVEEISTRKTESLSVGVEEISTRKAAESCGDSASNVSEQALASTAENLDVGHRPGFDSGAGTKFEVSSAAVHVISQWYQKEVQKPESKLREPSEQAKGFGLQRSSATPTAENRPPQSEKPRVFAGEVSEVSTPAVPAESCGLPRPQAEKVSLLKRVTFPADDLVSKPLGERSEQFSPSRREDSVLPAKAPPTTSLDSNAFEKSHYRVNNYEAQQRVHHKPSEASGAPAERSGTADHRAVPESAEKAGPGESREMDASRRVRENTHFVWVNNKRYQKLGRIGSGGSSHVFKVIAQDCTIYALKRISLKGRDYQSACGFHQEIEYLERLKGKRHIIQLIDYEVTDKTIFSSDNAFQGDIQTDVRIYMVLEYGEIDLAHMLEHKKNEGGDLDENWLRLYWEHILKAVYTIHEERIVHADLKPANFLLVQGSLKLIDFGIAKAIQNDTTNIVRESQVGTVNYMSPEAFMMNSDDNGTVKCGRPSDIWSLGCILYQMVHGRTPFHHLAFYQKIAEITNPRHVINFPPVANPLILDVMKRCLVWDKEKRPRIPELLEHPFLRPRPPEDHFEDLKEALLQACKSYVSIKGNVQLNELLRRLVKGTAPSDPCRDQVDNVLIPFVRLYIQKAGTSALRELLTSVVL